MSDPPQLDSQFVERLADLVAAKVLVALSQSWMRRDPQPSLWERARKFLKGKKTVIFGLLLPIVPIVIDQLGSTDWQKLGLSPVAGAVIGAIIIALRAGTNTELCSKHTQNSGIRA